MRGWDVSARGSEALLERLEAARIFQRIARGDEPPDAVEPQALHRRRWLAARRLVRRIERPAEQADAQAGTVRQREARLRGGSRLIGVTGRPARWPRTRYLKVMIDPDRAAGVEAAGRDADLGAEAEFPAVGELGRGVVQDYRRIHLGQEFFRRAGSPVTIASVWCDP